MLHQNPCFSIISWKGSSRGLLAFGARSQLANPGSSPASFQVQCKEAVCLFPSHFFNNKLDEFVQTIIIWKDGDCFNTGLDVSLPIHEDSGICLSNSLFPVYSLDEALMLQILNA